MSDVEFMTQRNWEQRRHAEEYAAMMEAEEWERQDREVIRIANRERIATAALPPRNDKSGYGSKGWKVKAARAAGRMALVMSAASALAGLELLFPLFGLVAVIFYTLYFEFQKGRNGLWHKI